MKIKNLVVGTLLVGSLFTVGCQSTNEPLDYKGWQKECGVSVLNLATCKDYDAIHDKLNIAMFNSMEKEDLEVLKYVIDNTNDLGKDVDETTQRYLAAKYRNNEDAEYIINFIGNHKNYKNKKDNSLYSDYDEYIYYLVDFYLDELGVQAIDINTFYNRITPDEYLENNLEAPTPEIDYNNVHCDNCGEVIPSDHIDSYGGYWCENCDYVK